MAVYLYIRVSTGRQTFDRQMVGIRYYFDQRGMDINKVDGIVEEKMSGGKSFEDRKLKQLLSSCKPGDIIYVASTDRLGRSFLDMMKLMADAKEHGVKIVACKQDLSLDDNNPTTLIYLAILTIMDEDERVRISERNKEKCAWQKEQIVKHGFFIIEKGPNKGKKCYKLGNGGNGKGSWDKAREKAIKTVQDSALDWRENSKAYQAAKLLFIKGLSQKEILERLHRMYELEPENYGSRTGKKIDKGTLSRWCREINTTIDVQLLTMGKL